MPFHSFGLFFVQNGVATDGDKRLMFVEVGFYSGRRLHFVVIFVCSTLYDLLRTLVFWRRQFFSAVVNVQAVL